MVEMTKKKHNLLQNIAKYRISAKYMNELLLQENFLKSSPTGEDLGGVLNWFFENAITKLLGSLF